jgi:hypothetical protein
MSSEKIIRQQFLHKENRVSDVNSQILTYEPGADIISFYIINVMRVKIILLFVKTCEFHVFFCFHRLQESFLNHYAEPIGMKRVFEARFDTGEMKNL